MSVLENLEPKRVFHFFEEISNIPRGSGNEQSVSNFVMRFAEEKGLYCHQDEAYNLFIRKPASPGYENAPVVMLQGHLDMVCEKNSDVKHDFLTDPIQLKIEDGFVTAEGTTLGADNGIAVAYAMAIIEDQALEHPPLEILLTTDEEVGMKGAKAFKGEKSQAKMLINLDSEAEGKLLVSCCGGRRILMTLPVERQKSPKWGTPYLLKIKGLKGGHSGADVHLGRANANKLMGRVLFALANLYEHRIADINGGNMDNAITREAEAVLLLHENDAEEIKTFIAKIETTFIFEFLGREEEISVTLERLDEKVLKVFTPAVEKKIVYILSLIPNGITTMYPGAAGFVESSSNIGIVRTEEDVVVFQSAMRSSSPDMITGLYNQHASVAFICDAQLDYTGDYPSWEYNPDSALLAICKEAYQDMYGKEADVVSIHAGLECGLLGEKIPGLDMISIGPDMSGVHSPEEKLDIESTERVWDYLKEVLKRIK